MRITDFDFELPDELIARYPASERRASRLLAVGDGLADRKFAELPALLEPGDLLVFNDTRVIPARLAARKESGGRVEILIERIESDDTAIAHVKASKAPKPGSSLILDSGLAIDVTDRDGGFFRLGFATKVMDVLEAHGEVPLPPYLGREAEPDDVHRYQTVYARDPGAVAAPTAGLHFDEAMLDETRSAGVRHAWVTLHVGAGTFQSLREEDIESNRLHSEWLRVSEDCATAVRETQAAGKRVVAVGTTVVRALEAASSAGQIASFEGETDIFIVPGYEFRSIDAMLTNFHLPQSSLLMLVSAFAGRQRILEAYEHAVAARYRFFSYGDAMFLTPGETR